MTSGNDQSARPEPRPIGEPMPPQAAAPTRRLVVFLALLAVGSLPFWALDLVARQGPDWVPDNLPLSALMVVVPALAAAILIGRRDGRAGLGRWLRRVAGLGTRRGPARWAFVVLAMPVAYLLAYGLMWCVGKPLPSAQIALTSLPVLLLVYGLAAGFEELGWTGYATDALLNRRGVWLTGVILGAAWAVWHIPGYVNGGNSFGWIVWQCVFTILLRVLIVWTYACTGRGLFAAITVHALSNVSWNLFPDNGSGYDPMYTSITLAAILAIVALARPSVATAGTATSSASPADSAARAG